MRETEHLLDVPVLKQGRDFSFKFTTLQVQYTRTLSEYMKHNSCSDSRVKATQIVGTNSANFGTGRQAVQDDPELSGNDLGFFLG